VYAAIEAVVQEGIATISEVCSFMEVNRTAFYAWRASEPTLFEEQDAQLAPLIRVIFKKHRRRYGARRIASELRDNGHTCSARRVSGIMKTLGLRAIQPKSFVPKTTDSRHRLGYSPNLLIDAESPTGINQIWIGDITYIPLEGGVFCYLALLMDLYSRRIVGWSLRADMPEALVLAALRTAIKERQPAPNLIHHTDRGGQYAGNEYRAVMHRAQMRDSMSRADNCYDNAFMESGIGTIKNELEMTEYKSIREALKEIAEYIRYYNFERKHSAIEYLTPAQFEQLTQRSK
jgi:transposase InsO family protein